MTATATASATFQTHSPTADPHPLPDVLERAKICARSARDNKGRDVIIMDLRKLSPMYDIFVISTGSSRRQIHALAEEADARMREIGDSRQGIEGYEVSKWIVQDYGDLLVHTFDPVTRDFYNLEDLWADAPRIEWDRE